MVVHRVGGTVDVWVTVRVGSGGLFDCGILQLPLVLEVTAADSEVGARSARDGDPARCHGFGLAL
jgi:hypothetical protein